MTDYYKKAVESLGLHEITCWYRFEDGGLVFNHADLGHSYEDKPKPKCPAQEKSWSGGKWSKLFTYGDVTRWPMLINPWAVRRGFPWHKI